MVSTQKKEGHSTVLKRAEKEEGVIELFTSNMPTICLPAAWKRKKRLRQNDLTWLSVKEGG